MARTIIREIERFDESIVDNVVQLSDNYFKRHEVPLEIIMQQEFGRTWEINRKEEDNFSLTYQYPSEPVRQITFPIENLYSGGRDPRYQGMWAHGMILGTATGNILKGGYIEVKLFNHCWDDRGEPAWLVKIQYDIIRFYNREADYKGINRQKVWKQVGNRDAQSGGGKSQLASGTEVHNMGDGSGYQYYESELGKWVWEAPGCSLGYAVDPTYHKYSPNLPMYEAMFDNDPYNYNPMFTYSMFPSYDANISEIVSNGFSWSAKFNIGNTVDQQKNWGNIVRRGVCLSKVNTTPTVDDTVILAKLPKSYKAVVNEKVSSLDDTSIYYVRAFVERELYAGGTVVHYERPTGMTVETKYTYVPPVCEPAHANAIGNDSIKVFSHVHSSGAQEWTECGYVYSKIQRLPTLENSSKLIVDRISAVYYGTIEATIKGLQQGETYYIRPYVKTATHTHYFGLTENKLDYYTDKELKERGLNKQGIFQVTIDTEKEKPNLGVTTLINITQTTVEAAIVLTNDGGEPIIESGVLFSLVPKPTKDVYLFKIPTSYVAGLGLYAEVTGLTKSTTYYVRGYAINSKGISYSIEKQMTTDRPVEFKGPKATNLSSTGATLSVVIDSQKPETITRQGFVFSAKNSTASTLNIDSTNIVKDAPITGNGRMSVVLVDLEFSGAKYYYRPFVEDGSNLIYGDVSQFETYKNIFIPKVELKNIKSNNKTEEITATVVVSSNGGEKCKNYAVISTINGEITKELRDMAEELSPDSDTGVGTFEVVFEVPDSQSGFYKLQAFSTNSVGVVDSVVVGVAYVKSEPKEPVASISAFVVNDGIVINAHIIDDGQSNIISKELKLKNISASTEETLTMEASAVETSIFEYKDIKKLAEETSYELELTVNTEYTQSIGIPLVKTAAFVTPDRWVADIAEEENNKPEAEKKQFTVSLLRTGYRQDAKFLPIFTVNVTGIIVEGAQVKLVRLKQTGNKLIGSSNINLGEGSEVLTLTVSDRLERTFSFEPTLSLAGMYSYRAFYIENTLEYGSETINSQLYPKDIVSTEQDPVDPEAPLDPNIFALPLTGLYDGLEYLFGGKRWVYNRADGAWGRDYGYKEMVMPANPTFDYSPQIEALRLELESKAYREELWTKVDRSINMIESIHDLDRATGTGFYQLNNFSSESYLPFDWDSESGSVVSMLVMEVMDADISYQMAFYYNGVRQVMTYRSISYGSPDPAPNFGWQEVITKEEYQAKIDSLESRITILENK